MNNDIFYNPDELKARPGFLKMLIGNRGGGKSYGWKCEMIRYFLATGKKFVWLRRYETEITGTPGAKAQSLVHKFTTDLIQNNAFPDHDLKVKGKTFYVDDQVAGVFIPLSKAITQKSVPFNDFDYIIFDEFIITKNRYHYLPDEVTEFLDFIETVNRLRLGDDDKLEVICIANAIKFANPYFIHFNIPVFNTQFWTNKERGIVVQLYKNEKFIELKKASRFGKLIAGTRYESYAVDNEFLLDNNKFIAPKSKAAKFSFAIRYGKHTLGFWVDYEAGNCYVNKSYPNTTHNLYTLRKDDQDVNVLLIKSARSTILDNALYLFRCGRMFYDNITTKSIALEALSYFI